MVRVLFKRKSAMTSAATEMKRVGNCSTFVAVYLLFYIGTVSIFPIVISYQSMHRPTMFKMMLRHNSWKPSKNLFLRLLSSTSGFSSPSSSTVVISSSSNEHFKFLKSLHQKKFRDKSGMIMMEGFKSVSDAIGNLNLNPKQIYVSNSVIHSEEFQYLHKLLEGINFPRRNFYQITDQLYNQVSQTESGQGVVAVFERPTIINEEKNILLYSPKETKGLLILLLDRISDPGNMGTIIRTAYGLGVNAIISVEGCDIWSPKVIRASTGLGLKLPIAETTWDIKEVQHWLDAFQREYQQLRGAISSSSLMTNEFWQILLAQDYHESVDYSRVDYVKPTVLVMGSEADGIHLTAGLLPGTKTSISIPMIRSLESFNVGIATSIILAEAAKSRLIVQ